MNFFVYIILFLTVFCASANEVQPTLSDEEKKAIELIKETNHPKTLNAMAQKAYQNKQYKLYTAALEQHKKIRPHNGEVMYKLAGAYALLGDKEKSFQMLFAMQQQGLAYDHSGNRNFDSLKSYQLYDHIADLIKEARLPFGKAEILTTGSDAGLIPTDVEYDANNNRYFISSAKNGNIYQLSTNNELSVFIKPTHKEHWSIMGLAIDSKRGHLWTTSAALPMNELFKKENSGKSSILKFDLKSGKLLKTYPIDNAGVARELCDLVVSKTGQVYATDQRIPVIYTIKPGQDSVEALLSNKSLISLRGITLDSNDRFLYVSDYVYGIIAIELATNKQFIVKGENKAINLGGIDSLSFYDNSLIAIQNFNYPERVMRFELNEDLVKITKDKPLLANQSNFDSPMRGTVVNDDLIFVANSQIKTLAKHGKNYTGLKPITLLKTNAKEAVSNKKKLDVTTEPLPKTS